MRGKPQAQPDFLTVINLNQSVPADHPLRAIKSQVDAVLKKLSPLFDALYAEDGRSSIPPEQLLKARVLTALYSVRSERLFCEQLGYNLLWLWFLDREFHEGSFDHSIFAKNYERVLSADVAKLFFLEVYDFEPAGRLDQGRPLHCRRHADRSVGEPEKLRPQRRGRPGQSGVGQRRRSWQSHD